MNFLQTLSDYFEPEVLRGEKPVRDPAVAERYQKIPALIDAFLPILERNKNHASAVWERSWECLEFYAKLCRMLAGVLYEAACGNGREMDILWEQTRAFACNNELRFQREWDVFEFLNIWENKILYRFRSQTEMFVE